MNLDKYIYLVVCIIFVLFGDPLDDTSSVPAVLSNRKRFTRDWASSRGILPSTWPFTITGR